MEVAFIIIRWLLLDLVFFCGDLGAGKSADTKYWGDGSHEEREDMNGSLFSAVSEATIVPADAHVVDVAVLLLVVKVLVPF